MILSEDPSKPPLATVKVPVGVLDSDVTITLSPIKTPTGLVERGAIGQAILVEPDGFRFEGNVVISIWLSNEALGSVDPDELVLITNQPGSGSFAEVLAEAMVVPEGEGARVHGSVDHFSPFSVAVVEDRGFLTFPVVTCQGGVACTPFNAPVTSIFDHSPTDTPDGDFFVNGDYPHNDIVEAFNGESGLRAIDSREDCLAQENVEPFLSTTLNYKGVSSYGPSYLCYDGHPAYDYGFPTGTPIVAPAAGTVEFTGFQSSCGHGVLLRHHEFQEGGNFDTLYCHLVMPAIVAEGDSIEGGATIGYSGCSGACEGPHLHFEVRRRNSSIAVDPYQAPGMGSLWRKGSADPSPSPPPSPPLPPPPSPPPQTGALQVITTTSGDALDPDGYRLLIDESSYGTIEVNGSVEIQGLNAGNHSVELMDLAGNCAVSGENPRTVSIPVGGTNTTNFHIACASAALSVENDDGFIDDAGTYQESAEEFHVGDGNVVKPLGLVYRVSISNGSAFAATGISVVDMVAPNSGAIECRDILPATPGGGANPTHGGVVGGACSAEGFTWSIGTLDAGQSAEIFFRSEAIAPQNGIGNRVRVSATELSGEIVDEEITAVDGSPVVGIEVDDGIIEANGVYNSAKEVFQVGNGSESQPDSLVYRVRVVNQGVTAVTQVVVIDEFVPQTGEVLCREIRATTPSGGPNPSVGAVVGGKCSASGFTWDIGTLGPGEEAVIFYRAEAVQPGSIINRVRLTVDGISGEVIEEEHTVIQ